MGLSPAITVVLLELGDWQPWLAEASRLLDPAEAERVRRRRSMLDRNALTLAYALHRLLLGHVADQDPSEVQLYRDELGCPRLAGDIAYTSLSHSEGLIALAVTTSGPVGVDIEPVGRSAVMAEIAGCVCHPSEADELAGLDETTRAAAMLALWVRKESVLKAAGIGLAVPIESFAAPEHAALSLPGLFPDTVQVQMLDAGNACLAAVAGARGVAIDCRWLWPGCDTGTDSKRNGPVG